MTHVFKSIYRFFFGLVMFVLPFVAFVLHTTKRSLDLSCLKFCRKHSRTSVNADGSQLFQEILSDMGIWSTSQSIIFSNHRQPVNRAALWFLLSCCTESEHFLKLF